MIPKVLRLFVKTFNGGHKYSLLYRENVKKPIQIPLSQKQKLFSEFVSAFLNCTSNFEHFQKKKNDPHSSCISEITESKKRG